jgi:hypothetical protein
VETETTVRLHAGMYLAHDLMSAMPLVCTGTYVGIPGELMWERTAQALQHVQPDRPYPHADAFTIFVRAHESTALCFRCDIVVDGGTAVATIVHNGVPSWRHAPIAIDEGDDVVAIARRFFAAGLPA